MSRLKQAAPFAYEGLDRIFHEKARLGIVSSLAGHADGLGFSDLKSLCSLTDGNLSRHLQVLEGAGYIHIKKDYDGKRPHTRCRLSAEGHTRFSEYLAALEQVLRKATKAARRAHAPARTALEQPS
ncbi:MAG: winged helix-turn-helix domain-containing protein [Rhizomicrobium sp.]